MKSLVSFVLLSESFGVFGRTSNRLWDERFQRDQHECKLFYSKWSKNSNVMCTRYSLNKPLLLSSFFYGEGSFRLENTDPYEFLILLRLLEEIFFAGVVRVHIFRMEICEFKTHAGIQSRVGCRFWWNNSYSREWIFFYPDGAWGGGRTFHTKMKLEQFPIHVFKWYVRSSEWRLLSLYRIRIRIRESNLL